MSVLRNMVYAVFGCQHVRLTRPFTIQQQCYMVCLECGQKVYYSAEKMRRLSRREVRRIVMSETSPLTFTPVTPSIEVASHPADSGIAA